MDLTFSNVVNNPAAKAMARTLEEALLSIDEIQGSTELSFATREFKPDEPKIRSAKCAISFALLDQEGKNVFLPLAQLSSLDGYFAYSNTKNTMYVFSVGPLAITRGTLQSICEDGVKEVLYLFRRG
jgi:hypothetical protein